MAKSGIMHIRKKKAERCEVVYEVEGEEIPMVSSYKYLGCVVDEYLELTEMVEDKAESGRRALGACLQRCRAEIGDVGVGVFQKLMGSLVESGMMYGSKYGVALVIWNPLNVFSCVLSVSSLGWAYSTPRYPCYLK